MDMESKTVMITGGTGLVGRHLTQHLLDAGHRVIVLTRKPSAQRAWHERLQYAAWDVKAQTLDAAALAEADAIVHLAGAGVVDKPWTPAYKKEIADSRVQSGQLLVHALNTQPNNVKTVVSASAIGWYGADQPAHPPFVETDPADTHFLGETCRQWEAAISPVAGSGRRLVICRIGIVLANDGGALPEFKKSLAFRVAGVLGNGRQMVSWIHIDDLCRIFQTAIENESYRGIYNAVAPQPVSNRALNLALGKAMYGSAFLTMPVPAFVLRLMMGERSIEVLKSTTVSSQKLTDQGFAFSYPAIDAALGQLVHG